MIKQIANDEISQYLEYAYEIGMDLKHSAYPTYTDGLKTKEDFFKSAQRVSTEDEKWEAFLYLRDGKVQGWIHLYSQIAEKYCHTDAFSIQSGTAEALHEFTAYLRHRYPGFTLDMGFPDVNTEAAAALKAEGFVQIEYSHVNVMKLANYQKKDDSKDVVPVTLENESLFHQLHDPRNGTMYWTSERILKEYHVPKQTRWHLYLLMDGDKTAACIYFLFVRNMMEVFGIDYLDQFEPDSFRKLMIKALNVTKDADIFGTYNFTDDDEEEKILQELGMDYQGDYTAYQMIL